MASPVSRDYRIAEQPVLPEDPADFTNLNFADSLMKLVAARGSSAYDEALKKFYKHFKDSGFGVHIQYSISSFCSPIPLTTMLECFFTARDPECSLLILSSMKCDHAIFEFVFIHSKTLPNEFIDLLIQKSKDYSTICKVFDLIAFLELSKIKFINTYFSKANAEDHPKIFAILRMALAEKDPHIIQACFDVIKKLGLGLLLPGEFDFSHLLTKDKEGRSILPKDVTQCRAPFIHCIKLPKDIHNQLIDYIANPTKIEFIDFDESMVELYEAALRVRFGNFIVHIHKRLLCHRYKDLDLPVLVGMYKIANDDLRDQLRDILLAFTCENRTSYEYLDKLRQINKHVFHEIDVGSVVQKRINVNFPISPRISESELNKIVKRICNHCRNIQILRLQKSVMCPVLCEELPKLEKLTSLMTDVLPETSKLRLTSLELQHDKPVALEELISPTTTALKYRGPVAARSHISRDNSARWGQLTNFEVEDQEQRGDVSYLEDIIPHLKSVTCFGISGFIVRKETLELINKEMGKLISFSGCFTNTTKVSGHDKVFNSGLTIQIINDFLKARKELVELSLNIERLTVKLTDSLVFLPNVRTLKLQCSNETFLIKVIDHYHSQSVREDRQGLVHLSVKCSSIDDHVLKEIGLMRSLNTLEITGVKLTPLQVTRLCESLSLLKKLTMQAHREDKTHIESILQTMRNMEVKFAKEGSTASS